MANAGGSRAQRMGVGLAVGALLALTAVDLDLASLVSFWGDRSFLVPLAAALGAALWLTPLRRLLAVVTVLLGVLWLAVAFTPLVAWMAEGLVRRDTLRPADAVFVFASRVQADGEPTSHAMSRLEKGLELVVEGHAKTLVVSELPPPARPYAALARVWARTFAPGTEVLVVGPVTRSRDEALAVGRLFRARGWRRVLAVTSPVHTRRAAASLEKQGLEVAAAPSVETQYDLETLDMPGDRRLAFGPIAHERIGLLVYEWRGWI